VTFSNRSYRLLLPSLVIIFVLVSVAEVWLLTVVGSWIGIGWTLTILVAEAFLGAWLLRSQGSKSWQALVGAYEAGRIPTGQLADAALVLTGGVMLILPGFFTDIIGLAFLLPPTRHLARKGIGWLVAHSAWRANLPGRTGGANSASKVVPGEVVDSQPSTSPSSPEVIISGDVEA
jgi:UPF0716 protein FxsA